MTREEALATANQLVAEWTSQVKNERGYAHDKWTPVDLASRVDAVLRISEWLMRPVAPSKLMAPQSTSEPGPDRILGWAIDGSGGPPSRTQYHQAKQRQETLAGGGHVVDSREPMALDLLVDAYEENASPYR